MIRKSQDTTDIILPVPGILTDGTNAQSLSVDSFTTAITAPDGTAVINYTEPTITNPNSNGIYICKFPTSANSDAFTDVNSANPYTFTLNHPEADFDPMGPIEVWIADRYEWELAQETALSSLDTRTSSIGTQISSLETRTTSIGVEVSSNATAISSIDLSRVLGLMLQNHIEDRSIDENNYQQTKQPKK